MFQRPVLSVYNENVRVEAVFKKEKSNGRKGLQVDKSNVKISKKIEEPAVPKKLSQQTYNKDTGKVPDEYKELVVSKKSAAITLPFEIFSDPENKVCQHCDRPSRRMSSLKTTDSCGIQVGPEGVQEAQVQVTRDDISLEELHDVLCADKAPESYWKDIAEQRRLALEETLNENELLYYRNAELQEEMDRMRLIANQVETFAGMLKLPKKESIEEMSS